MRRLALLSLACLALAACTQAPKQVFRFQKPLMHTQWDFSLVASDEAKARAAMEKAAAEVERLDKELAMWREDSELHRINAAAGKGPQKVSPELAELVAMALKTGEESGGSFDISVAPLVQLWYYSLKAKKVPPRAKISEALAKVDYRRIGLKGDQLEIPEGMSIDLGGMAKGYAQDRAAALLRKDGIRAFLLNAGGQVYAAGHKPDGEKWRVGIMNPRLPGKVAAIRELEDQCMSTSGDYEQFVAIQGKRYHHILDAKTGYPTTNGVASATVILPFSLSPMPAALSDAIDTPALILGPGKGLDFITRHGASGVVLVVEGKGLRAEISKDLEGKIELEL
jgi:thiamine biosynthesis lipoprotein